jgi:hypothetical protein
MPIQKEEQLSELFQWRPIPIYDPVPWLLKYLEKEHIFQAARVQVELQRSMLTAYGKALDQIEGVLKTAGSKAS